MYKYKEERMQIFTESAVYTAGKKRLIDPRIHCVLFFLRGPRIFEEDWKLLSELQKYVSIIPIIAKGDIYTQS